MSPGDMDRQRPEQEDEYRAEIRRRRSRLLIGVTTVILLCLVGMFIAFGLRSSGSPETSSDEASSSPETSSDEAPSSPGLQAAAGVEKLLGDFGARLDMEMPPALSQPPDIENGPMEAVQQFAKETVLPGLAILERNEEWLRWNIRTLLDPMREELRRLDDAAEEEQRRTVRLSIAHPRGQEGTYDGLDESTEEWVVVVTDRYRPREGGPSSPLGPIVGDFVPDGTQGIKNPLGQEVHVTVYRDASTENRDRAQALREEVAELEGRIASATAAHRGALEGLYTRIMDRADAWVHGQVESIENQAVADLRQPSPTDRTQTVTGSLREETLGPDTLTRLLDRVVEIPGEGEQHAETVLREAQRELEEVVRLAKPVLADLGIESQPLVKTHPITSTLMRLASGDIVSEPEERLRTQAREFQEDLCGGLEKDIEAWIRSEVDRLEKAHLSRLKTPSVEDRVGAVSALLEKESMGKEILARISDPLSQALADWNSLREGVVEDLRQTLPSVVPTSVRLRRDIRADSEANSGVDPVQAACNRTLAEYSDQRPPILQEVEREADTLEQELRRRLEGLLGEQVARLSGEAHCPTHVETGTIYGMGSGEDGIVYVVALTDRRFSVVRHDGKSERARYDREESKYTPPVSWKTNPPRHVSFQGDYILLRHAGDGRVSVLNGALTWQLFPYGRTPEIILPTQRCLAAIWFPSKPDLGGSFYLFDTTGEQMKKISNVRAYQRKGDFVLVYYESKEGLWGAVRAYDLGRGVEMKDRMQTAKLPTAEERIAYRKSLVKRGYVAVKYGTEVETDSEETKGPKRPSLSWTVQEMPLPVGAGHRLIHVTIHGKAGRAEWLQIDPDGSYEKNLTVARDGDCVAKYDGAYFFGGDRLEVVHPR